MCSEKHKVATGAVKIFAISALAITSLMPIALNAKEINSFASQRVLVSNTIPSNLQIVWKELDPIIIRNSSNSYNAYVHYGLNPSGVDSNIMPLPWTNELLSKQQIFTNKGKLVYRAIANYSYDTSFVAGNNLNIKISDFPLTATVELLNKKTNKVVTQSSRLVEDTSTRAFTQLDLVWKDQEPFIQVNPNGNEGFYRVYAWYKANNVFDSNLVPYSWTVDLLIKQTVTTNNGTQFVSEAMFVPENTAAGGDFQINATDFPLSIKLELTVKGETVPFKTISKTVIL